MIGNYARQFSEKGVEKLSISFLDTGVTAEATVQGSAINSSSSHENVFFSVDLALREIHSKL